MEITDSWRSTGHSYAEISSYSLSDVISPSHHGRVRVRVRARARFRVRVIVRARI